MANTYTLISSTTLGSTSQSVTFSSIPSTYTDLAIKMSIRSDRANTWFIPTIRFNNDSGSNYSWQYIRYDAGSLGGNRSVNQSYGWVGVGTGSTSATNFFGISDVYISNYSSSLNKSFTAYGVTANTNSTTHTYTNTGLWRNTSAVSTIVLDASLESGGNFVSGSSFYLYGISKS